MDKEQAFQFNLDEEVERFFDDSSMAKTGEPELVIIMGAVAVGKTTFRNDKFKTGYVILDAAEIFLNLCQGEFEEFPGDFEVFLDIIGDRIAKRAISERRNMVAEVNGFVEPEDINIIHGIRKKMEDIGYSVKYQLLNCDVEEAWERNVNRENNNISSFYYEGIHFKWLSEAANDLGSPDKNT